MSQFSLRLPDDLHRKAAALAKKQNVSMNQFFLYAISSMVSNLETQSFFEDRLQQPANAAKADALAVLDTVPSRPVLRPDDELSPANG